MTGSSTGASFYGAPSPPCLATSAQRAFYSMIYCSYEFNFLFDLPSRPDISPVFFPMVDCRILSMKCYLSTSGSAPGAGPSSGIPLFRLTLLVSTSYPSAEFVELDVLCSLLSAVAYYDSKISDWVIPNGRLGFSVSPSLSPTIDSDVLAECLFTFVFF